MLTVFLFFLKNFSTNTNNFRSRRSPAFYEIAVFKTFWKFIGTRICWSLLSINLLHGYCSRNIAKFLRTPFLQNLSGWIHLILRKLNVQTFNSKQICSLDQYCRQAVFNEQKHGFYFYWSRKLENHISIMELNILDVFWT